MQSISYLGPLRALTAHYCLLKPWAVLAILSVFTLLPSLKAMGENVVTIEEDWVLEIGDPDTNSAGPQIVCSISPSGNLDGYHAVLELNHRSLPDFTAGGLQMQLWNGEQQIAFKSFPEKGLICHSSEAIRWTTRMSLQNGQLIFEVVNGTSQSWNNFGGQGYLKHAFDTSLTSLEGYKPSVSSQNSGIGYAANRVNKLSLKELRVTTQSGEVFTDSTERVVHGN